MKRIAMLAMIAATVFATGCASVKSAYLADFCSPAEQERYEREAKKLNDERAILISQFQPPTPWSLMPGAKAMYELNYDYQLERYNKKVTTLLRRKADFDANCKGGV